MHVQHDRLLAAVPGLEARQGTGGHSTWWLHEYDVGACLGEHHGGRRAGDAVRKVDNPDVVQDPGLHGAAPYVDGHRGLMVDGDAAGCW